MTKFHARNQLVSSQTHDYYMILYYKYVVEI